MAKEANNYYVSEGRDPGLRGVVYRRRGSLEYASVIGVILHIRNGLMVRRRGLLDDPAGRAIWETSKEWARALSRHRQGLGEQ